MIGGGARSAAWNQIKADVLSVPYQRLARDRVRHVGRGADRGHAVGLFADLAEAACAAAQRRRRARRAATRTPQAAVREDCIAAVHRWQETAERLLSRILISE